MAKVIAGLGTGFLGSVDNLSFYTMKGVQGTIARKKRRAF